MLSASNIRVRLI